VILGPMLATTVVVISLSGIFAGSLGGISDYAVYTLSGVVFVQFTSFGLSGVANSITASRGIISKMSTPSLLFPLASGLSALITWAITTTYVVVVNFVITNRFPSPLVIFFCLIYGLFLFGLGLLISTLNVHYEDVTSILPIAVQGITFLTPIFYSPDIWPPRIAEILTLNPIYWFLQLYRYGVGVGPPPSLSMTLEAIAIAIFALALGFFVHVRAWSRVVRSL
jgi:ABC-2 type transport system permease protein